MTPLRSNVAGRPSVRTFSFCSRSGRRGHGRCSCVFEGERVYGGQVFKLNEHSQRLIDSAKLMGFELPYSLAEINEATNATIKAGNIVDGYVRPVAWRGSAKVGVSAHTSKIHLAIAVRVWPSCYTLEAKMKGIRLALATGSGPGPTPRRPRRRPPAAT